MFKTASAKKREKCCVCGQKHPDLVALECSHLFCSACLRQAIAHSRSRKLVVCDMCQHTTLLTDDLLKERVSRKSYKSTEKKREETQPDRNTIQKDHINANSKGTIMSKQTRSNLFLMESPSAEKQRHCNYHFNEKTHVCVTCLRGVCVRCLQTLCEEHKVYNKQKGTQVIKKELVSLYTSKVEETELKFKQLNERKKFYEQRYQKVGEQIHSSFNHMRDALTRKEEELLEFCQILHSKIDQEYELICQAIQMRITLLNDFKSIVSSDDTEIDRLKRQLKQISSLGDLNIDLTYNFQLDKIVDESRMERILFQIEQLTNGPKHLTKQRKFRTSTENAQRGSMKVFRSIPPTHKASVRQH